MYTAPNLRTTAATCSQQALDASLAGPPEARWRRCRREREPRSPQLGLSDADVVRELAATAR